MHAVVCCFNYYIYIYIYIYLNIYVCISIAQALFTEYLRFYDSCLFFRCVLYALGCRRIPDKRCKTSSLLLMKNSQIKPVDPGALHFAWKIPRLCLLTRELDIFFGYPNTDIDSVKLFDEQFLLHIFNKIPRNLKFFGVVIFYRFLIINDQIFLNFKDKFKQFFSAES